MSRNTARSLPDGRCLESVGPTPLVRLQLEAGGQTLGCKLDSLNPGGSAKDGTTRLTSGT